MAGRTVQKHIRFYMDGYELGAYSKSLGVAGWSFDESEQTAFGDAAKGYLPDISNITLGPLNGVFDSTATSGLHVVASSVESERIITVAIGDRATPVAGVPVFCAQLVQLGYHGVEEGGAITANIPFGPREGASLIDYDRPWGKLLLPNTAKTAANSSGTGVVSYTGASTALGGYMVYHVFAASSAGHTATIKVQHSADEVDGNYADLGGCTTGVIDVGTAPISGIKATTAVTTTVETYLRWQITLGTATSVTFALSFIRG